jgi:LPS export ABC transporter permease LptG
MSLLDQYVLKKFLLPFTYCIVGFLAIWFIFDLSDNLSDFIEGKAGFIILLRYYQSQVPAIIVMCLPIAALLALLYSLSAMSRTNELISMLGAGRSVLRVLVPLFAMGLILTGVSFYFNYELAPHAALMKKQMLREIKSGKKKLVGNLEAHLFRNREDMRTWFMRRINVERNQLIDVEIIQQDAKSNITKTWYSQDAYFNTDTQNWVLYKARTVEFDLEGNVTKDESFPDGLEITGWRETPWRISSSVMNPDYLSVPELREYLMYNADFKENRLAPYRTSLQERISTPLACFLVVCIAAPLGIVYSRRGILASVMSAIGIFFTFFFMSIFFIALGKGNIISPVLAGWVPLATFLLVGCGLLWMRSTSRDLPKFKLPWA